MKVQKLFPLAATLGVWVGGAEAAESLAKSTKPTSTATVSNQKLAEAIAARLSSSTVAEGADITLVTDNGTVTVTGTSSDENQKKAILQEIRVVSGVKLVRDGVIVSPIRQAQNQADPVAQPMNSGFGPVQPNIGMVGMQPPGMSGPAVEPMPLGHPGMGPGDGHAPPLPPHAWPTYAPYNNLSRVAYPQAYPYNAFPFIGPFYPFPKVPLGWRSVTLTWEDGHWWMGRTSAPHDYWRVRFW